MPWQRGLLKRKDGIGSISFHLWLRDLGPPHIALENTLCPKESKTSLVTACSQYQLYRRVFILSLVFGSNQVCLFFFFNLLQNHKSVYAEGVVVAT